MPYSEDELLPISALQHVIYCERQAALIHVEQVWLDNVWTVEGNQLHEKVISGDRESRGEIRIARDVSMRSLQFGLTGRADVVEFHQTGKCGPGVNLPHAKELWRPFPVEYKRGRPKRYHADEIQLCAQALCLEEMFDIHIQAGALFYGQTRRRLDVRFDQDLRSITESAARRFREIISTGTTPAIAYDPARCDKCSLIAICRPQMIGRDTRRYIREALSAARKVERSV